MLTHPTFIPTAEAAFIADLTDRQMNRVVDEQLLPDVLFGQQGNKRLFTRLSAAFAKFYFDTEDLLIATARCQILAELTRRVERLHFKNEVFTLSLLPDDMNWKVARYTVEIDVAPYLVKVLARAKEVDLAGERVTTDPEIMGGVPVFVGSRVPIEIVLASVAAGVGMDRLRASYPFLTDEHLAAANIYSRVHPRRGRPPRLPDAEQEWPRRGSREVRPAQT